MGSFRDLVLKDGCDPTEEYLATLTVEENVQGEEWVKVLKQGSFDEVCEFIDSYEITGDEVLGLWSVKDFCKAANLIVKN